MLAAVIFFFVRSDGGSSSPSKKSVSGNVKLTLGGIQNANAGVPATLGGDAANQIMAAVGQYVDKGLIAPVKTAKPPTDVAGLFDAGTQTAIQGPDKDVLFENGQPKLTGDFKPAADPVIITALSDGNGQFGAGDGGVHVPCRRGGRGRHAEHLPHDRARSSPPTTGGRSPATDVTLTRQGARVEGSTTGTAKK